MSESDRNEAKNEERFEVGDDGAAGASPAEGSDVQALQRQRDELEQKVLRYAADYQNLARRSEQNIVTAREQQAMDFAKQLVVVLDHFDHALAVDAGKVSPGDLLQGVRIVQSELLSVLRRFGIERVEARPGDPFDPNRHEAMMRQPAEGVESGHVAQQFQPGYVLKEKTVRPAKVVVAD